jgi:uncharacterized glyoxalase superfamily protein PhnB
MLSPILSVQDIEASITFYTEILGFEHGWSMPPGPNGKTDFACVRFAGAEILLGTLDFVAPGDEDKRGTGIQLYLEVPADRNIDAIYERAKTGQAKITRAIENRDWGERGFNVKDPDGYHYMIAQRINKSEERS